MALVPGPRLRIALDTRTWDRFWLRALFQALAETKGPLEVTLVVAMQGVYVHSQGYRMRGRYDMSQLIAAAAQNLQARDGALTVHEML